ncbi:uncharacterized protein LOC107478772 [Arachis duranensis]|uniref:Uncharacterized protein LOC107478772 n=1 Tax=Arachis duranensis TaxID=130453 RepID=A0A6P4CPR6_ARADU|nr:uncharacterized protein LOC107478772 [Arachis duranensis]
MPVGLAHSSKEDEIVDDSREEAEVVPETQPLEGESVIPTRVELINIARVGDLSSSTPDHYLHLSLGPMNSTNVEDIPSNYGLTGEMELEVGLKFLNKDAAMLAIKNYNIRRSAKFKVVESDHTRFKFGSNVVIRNVSYNRNMHQGQSNQIWKEPRGSDQPFRQQHLPRYHRQRPSYNACQGNSYGGPSRDNQHPPNYYGQQPFRGFNTSTTQESVRQSVYGYKVSYKKVWLAKQKAIARIYGDWDDSYNQLQRYFNALQTFVPGTIVDLQTRPYYVGNTLERKSVMFHQVFWSFPLCVEAFKHCKLLVSVDGIHLYGKYTGTLLMGIAQDGNNNILLIAFVLVERENTDAWYFFLTNLRRHVSTQPGVLLISDRHAAIKAALE